MKPRSHNVGQIVKRSSHLGKLLETSRRQDKILSTIRQLIPKSIAEHCISSHYDGQMLKLFFDSPVWASRIRFEANQLKGRLNERHIPVHRIDIRVLPPSRLAPPAAPRHGPMPITQQAAESLIQAAEGVDDPALDKALRRLARHVKTKPS